tara:strand:+ start:42 stop:467 length:426 start_codon:yes stop_codon:yes gene_type:complete
MEFEEKRPVNLKYANLSTAKEIIQPNGLASNHTHSIARIPSLFSLEKDGRTGFVFETAKRNFRNKKMNSLKPSFVMCSFVYNILEKFKRSFKLSHCEPSASSTLPTLGEDPKPFAQIYRIDLRESWLWRINHARSRQALSN